MSAPGKTGKVLVTGGGGMLAGDLIPLLRGAGFEVFGPGRGKLDITSAGHVEAVLATLRPAVVFNCAAFTKVDLCESDPAAESVNDLAVGTLARACKQWNAKLIHISTDFVFDGTGRTPYREEDLPAPLCAYGRTKLAGERRALEAPGALVVRTSWLFGRLGANFVEAMLGQAKSGKQQVRVVADQTGRPTATQDLAAALIALLAADATGIVHFANAGEVSWNEFAREIYRQAGYDGIEVVKISSEELKRPARRPAYSSLSTEKYERLTGKTPRHFREPLGEYLRGRTP